MYTNLENLAAVSENARVEFKLSIKSGVSVCVFCNIYFSDKIVEKVASE